MADLFSLSMRRTSGKDGRPAMRAMSSGNSYHLRPHCTKRSASATTCVRASSEDALRSAGRVAAVLESGLAAGLWGAGFAAVAGFGGGLLTGFAPCLAGAGAVKLGHGRLVRLTERGSRRQ